VRTLQQTVFLTVSAMTSGLIATAPSVQASTQILQTSNNSLGFFARFPAAWNQSVIPSSDSIPTAGPLSASLPCASFVPQIALYGSEAEPVLMVQTDYKSESPMMTSSDISIPDTVISPQNYWAFVLDRYVDQNSDGLTQFDYAKLKDTPSDMDGLGAYIDHMAAQKPSAFSRDDAMAYWANLYNALTIQVVAQNYPVESIRKIKSGYRAGPWKRNLVIVEGNELSLDNIEHDILRPTYETPLVHYMVNCASVGCPNLKSTPWQGATLGADQEAAARAYINSPRGAKISDGQLQVSSIYKWFKADFGGDKAGVLAHLNQYADADLHAALKGRQKINKYTYDWDINAPK